MYCIMPWFHFVNTNHLININLKKTFEPEILNYKKVFYYNIFQNIYWERLVPLLILLIVKPLIS